MKRFIAAMALVLPLIVGIAWLSFPAQSMIYFGGNTVGGSGPVFGYDGVIAVSSTGQMVNGHGTAIQLRGANIALLDSTIYSNQPANQQCWGPYAGGGGPPWPTYGSSGGWNFNAARFTMNASAFLNVLIGTVTGSASAPVWGGTTHQADLNGVIKNCLINSIQWARANNLYIIIDEHAAAPSYTFSSTSHYVGAYGQPLFIDHNTGGPYWYAGYGAGPGVTDSAGYASSGIVAFIDTYFGSAAFNSAHGFNGGAAGTYYNSNYGGASGVNDIIFELFNEPYLDQQGLNFNTANLGAGSSQTAYQIMGNGGWVSGYCNQNIGTGTLNPGSIPVGIPTSLYGASGQANTTSNGFCFNWWWQADGYQTVLNGIRALGNTNVIQINGPGFTTGFGHITTYMPTDTLSVRQMSLGWHPYPVGSFPNNDDGYAGTKYALQFPQAMIAGSSSYTVNGTGFTGLGYKIPVEADETGTSGGPSATQPDPYIRSMTQWADGGTDTTNGVAFSGTFGVLTWNGLQSLPYGYGGSAQSWLMFIYGATQSVTGYVTSTQAAGYPLGTGEIVVTNANGNTITPGLVITSGYSSGDGFVGPQLSGTTGGAGTYVFSMNTAQGSSGSPLSMSGQYWLPVNGEGQTMYNWTNPHSP